MVEISHGDGFVTRYAHNKQNLVEPGDVVRKGEPVALMGTTGRATGAHVHFEVYKHGRPVDPASYISRTPR
jgi:murein DD-endopeptidase MepM/ murein hydrolase activator NlpD